MTVTAARGAIPRTSPLAPSMPLGTSIATTGSRRSLDCLDDRARHAFDRPRKTRTKDAVDDEPGAVERRRRQWLDLTLPAHRSLRRVAPQRSDGPEQREAHRPAALGQHARRDKAVAAVVSRAAEHRDRLRRPPPRNRIGHLAAGSLHQLDAGDAARDRQPIRLAHLRRGEQSVLAPALRRNLGESSSAKCGEHAICA